MNKVKTVSIFFLVLFIVFGLVFIYGFSKNKKTEFPELKNSEIDVSMLTVYETLPDYDYSGATLQLIFLDAANKPIRNFKGHLTLEGSPGTSPGSFSNYDYDSCKFALVESNPNNRAILAGGKYSFIVMENGKSHILPDKIEMPKITQGIKEYRMKLNISDLLGRRIEQDSYSGVTLTGDVVSLGGINSESYIVFDCDPVYSVIKIKADKTFEIRSPRLAGSIYVFDPRGQKLIAFKQNVDRSEIRDFEIIKGGKSLKLSIHPPFDLKEGSVSLALSKGKVKYAWATFFAHDPELSKVLSVPYGDYELNATESETGRSARISVSIKPKEKFEGKIFGRSIILEESED